MPITRRTYLAGMATMPLAWSSLASCATPAPALAPEDFGAHGNGTADDTDALQHCLDAAAARRLAVRLRQGAVYRVDTNRRPSWDQLGGLKLNSGQILELNGAELRALPSTATQGSVVQANGTAGWNIFGPGRITGERTIHRGTSGEWGMGISAWSSSGWTIGPQVEVNDCWGDGIYVGSAPGGSPCRKFVIEQVHVWNCRRNGISIVAGHDGEIRYPLIEKIDGTAPFGGIDLEPDHVDSPNRDIRIFGGRIRDAGVGIYATVANENVRIEGMDITAINSGILIGDNVHGLTIQNNPSIRSTRGGEEGGAIRSVGNAAKMHDIIIRNNSLSGGGAFVIDMFGGEYRNLQIRGNRLRASNKGVQGLARLSFATFVDNDCTIENIAGLADQFFVQFHDVDYGGNSYANKSKFKMFALIRRGRERGGERLDSSLWKAVEGQ